MGFISDLVASAFEIVEGIDSTLVESITYNYQASAPTYDTDTGLVSESVSSLTFNAVRTKLEKKEAVNLNGNPDLELLASDRVYVLPYNSLLREPAVGDTVTVATLVWQLVGWMSVPGDSLYKIVLRRP